MGAELLKFPQKPDDSCPVPPKPTTEAITPEAAAETLKVVDSIRHGTRDLLGFVDNNRHLSKRAGIESVAIELSGIMEGGQLDRLHDALDEGVVRQRVTHVTLQGLDRLRRAEGLLAEANSSMSKYVDYGHKAFDEEQVAKDKERRARIVALEETRLELLREEMMVNEYADLRALEGVRAPRRLVLAATTSEEKSDDTWIWISFAAIGALGVAYLIFAPTPKKK